ncbi:MAG: hypothetical protein WDN47_03150 [Candidatus Doudnabacteria bacterium]
MMNPEIDREEFAPESLESLMSKRSDAVKELEQAKAEFSISRTLVMYSSGTEEEREKSEQLYHQILKLEADISHLNRQIDDLKITGHL